METVVMEREFTDPLTTDGFVAMAMDAAGCMGLYRVDWYESLLALDGGSLICCFKAPDCESLRQMSRGDASAGKSVWAGAAHDTGREGVASVVVTRSFPEAVTLESVQAIEDAGAWCLEAHRVTFLRTYFSSDRKRMACLYQAPDAESVRLAQQQAGMPVDRIWACQHFTPENFLAWGAP